MVETVTLTLIEAKTLVERAFIAVGINDRAASAVANALVDAEADGQVGHGLSRLGDYIAQIRSGKVKKDANVTTRTAYSSAFLTDADCGLAYDAIEQAIEHGITAANTYGISAMAVTNSHHCGSLSIHVEKIAQAGLVGLMVTNSPPAIAPWGGNKPLFGTNPIAFAVPRTGQDPLVIDMSLSVVARGKIMHAAKTGQPIPEGWALDQEGRATTDPEQALQGSMLPVGGPKGTALALVVEVLAATMTGANFSFEASSFFTAEGEPPKVGHYLLALKPMEQETNFSIRIEELLNQILFQDGARLPGIKRFTNRARAEKEGITVPRSYIDFVRTLIENP